MTCCLLKPHLDHKSKQADESLQSQPVQAEAQAAGVLESAKQLFVFFTERWRVCYKARGEVFDRYSLRHCKRVRSSLKLAYENTMTSARTSTSTSPL